MDFGSTRVYEFELWSSGGSRLADISSLVQNRNYVMQRNEAETLTFDLDLYAFEAFCAGINTTADVMLNPYAVDVKVKRNGAYLFGVQIVAAPLNIGSNASFNVGQMGGGSGSFNPTITVTCKGYLNLFTDRYLTYSYSQQDAAFIAGDMLTQAQAATRGSVGVTLNSTNQYMTGVLRDRNYSRQNIKSELQNLTQLVDGRFDFAFDANKVFYTYQQIGSKRSDLQFTYGGPQSNIAGFYMENSATSLYNQIIGLGSGFGPDQLVSTQDDADSQLNRYLRQDIKQYNSVIDQNTLDQNAKADLALEKDLLRIPQITISGKELQGLTFLSVGDRIPLNFPVNSFLKSAGGVYRIEKMDVTLDDNDFEQSIILYFDNYAVNPYT